MLALPNLPHQLEISNFEFTEMAGIDRLPALYYIPNFGHYSVKLFVSLVGVGPLLVVHFCVHGEYFRLMQLQSSMLSGFEGIF